MSNVLNQSRKKCIILYKTSYSRYFKYIVWYRYGRKYEAPIEPFRLYSISPESVTLPVDKVGTVFECSIRDGEWDTRTVPFEENIHFKSLSERFENGTKWQNTPLYSMANNKIESGEGWMDCESESEVLEILGSYDDLYNSIARNGYKTQRELKTTGVDIDLLSRCSIQYRPLEFNEVTVDVGRNGELIWYSGQYRLSIAKILGLKSIPVRIRCRHKQWQQNRDEVWTNPTQYDEYEVTHPDLLSLLNRSNSMN